MWVTTRRSDPGTRPAGPLADRDLQAGRRLPDHRDGHVQGPRPHGGREDARRRLHHRRAAGGSPQRIMEITGGKGVDVVSTAPPAPARSRSSSASRP
jgi:hypothetical protein